MPAKSVGVGKLERTMRAALLVVGKKAVQPEVGRMAVQLVVDKWAAQLLVDKKVAEFERIPQEFQMGQKGL